jgi:IS5 family transposase
MLRVYFLQQWYNLSDPGMEEALYDSVAMRRFAGIATDADVIPDESSILGFQLLVETHRLTQALLAEVNRHLGEKGLLLGKGTIVGATIVKAPSSTKNASGSRDLEMHQTRKGKLWYLGMKAHTGTDADSGLVHTVVCTAANVHDAAVPGELLHGEEEVVYGDSAYQSEELQALDEQAGLDYKVCERPSRWRNRAIARVRAIGEHPYHVVKRLWGHVKVRYRGLAKNFAQMCTLFALANLYIARRWLLAQRLVRP